MRVRAGFISNSSTSSFVLFFGPPPASHFKKADLPRGKKAADAVRELSPQQCLQIAVEGAMESDWLDPFFEQVRYYEEECRTWNEDSDDEDESESEEEGDEEEGGEEGEVEEPQAKKSRTAGLGGGKEKPGKKQQKRSAREEKRWAAIRAYMTPYLTSAEPKPTADYIESLREQIDGLREQLEEKNREIKREFERRVKLGEDPIIVSMLLRGERSEWLIEKHIKKLEKQIKFVKRVQPRRPWCVEYSCSSDGCDAEIAMYYGMMAKSGKSGRHIAVWGENHAG